MGEPAGKFLKRIIGDIGTQALVPMNFLLGPKFLKLGLTKSQRDIENRVQQYKKWGL